MGHTMKRHTIIIATLTLGIVVGALIAPSVSPNKATAAATEARDAAAQVEDISKYEWWKNRGSRFVFFATLEGLYEDGVGGDVIDVIIPLVTPAPTDANPAPQPYRNTDINFIYMCPLCHPASEAFLLYSQRTPFRGQKTTEIDTFGDGVPAELVKKLKSDKPAIRRDAIQALIQRWVQRRIERTKMTDQQRTELTIELKLLKKAGLESLELFKKRRPGDYYRDLYADWKSCPVCEGGFGACAAPVVNKKPVNAPAPAAFPARIAPPSVAPPATPAPSPAPASGASITIPTPSSFLLKDEVPINVNVPG